MREPPNDATLTYDLAVAVERLEIVEWLGRLLDISLRQNWV